MLQQSAAVQTEYLCLANMNVWCAKKYCVWDRLGRVLDNQGLMKDLWDISWFKMAAEPPPAKLDYKSRRLVGQIVEYVKSQGIFDQFRRDCIEELEQKVSLIFSWSQ